MNLVFVPFDRNMSFDARNSCMSSVEIDCNDLSALERNDSDE